MQATHALKVSCWLPLYNCAVSAAYQTSSMTSSQCRDCPVALCVCLAVQFAYSWNKTATFTELTRQHTTHSTAKQAKLVRSSLLVCISQTNQSLERANCESYYHTLCYKRLSRFKNCRCRLVLLCDAGHRSGWTGFRSLQAVDDTAFTGIGET